MTYRSLFGLVLNIFSNDLEDSISNKLKKYTNHTRDKAIPMRQRFSKPNLKIMKFDQTGKNNLEQLLNKKIIFSVQHQIRGVKRENNIYYWCELVARRPLQHQAVYTKATYDSVWVPGTLHFHSCFWNSVFSSGHMTRKVLPNQNRLEEQ